MKIIAPSILSADFTNLSQQIRSVELGKADWIHCDIMDGKFVPNITFGPMVVKAVRRITNLPLDVHLMIDNPENYIKDFVDAGATYVTIHQETVTHLDRQIHYIKELGAKAGVSLNPATPISTLSEVLDIVDMVLIMSVNPGFGGQKLIENCLKKISELDKIKNERNLDFLIEIDGGINPQNIKNVSSKGCNVFVAGSTIFNQDNITASTLELKNLVSS